MSDVPIFPLQTIPVKSYEYDNLGRLVRLTESDPDGGGNLSASETVYDYDAVGNRTSVTDPRGQTTSYEYDDLGRATLVSQNVSGLNPTVALIQSFAAAGIPICHFSYGGWFHALTTGLVHKNVELRMAQFAAAEDPARSLCPTACSTSSRSVSSAKPSRAAAVVAFGFFP